MTALRGFCLSLLASLYALPCIAQEYYLLAQFGQSQYDTVQISDDTDTALALGLGVDLSPNLGLELSYNDFGQVGINNTDIDVTGFAGAVVGRVPVGASLDLYGKIGFDIWEADASNASTDGNDLFFGLGINYALSQSAALRLEYNRHDFSGESASPDLELDTFTIGVRFSL